MCTVASGVHQWRSDSFTDELIAVSTEEDVVNGDFTFRRVAVAGSILTSSVSVTSFPGLDNLVIQCLDALDIVEEQYTTAMVFSEYSPA